MIPLGSCFGMSFDDLSHDGHEMAFVLICTITYTKHELMLRKVHHRNDTFSEKSTIPVP